MKPLYTYLSLFFVCLFPFSQTQAATIIGAEIYYKSTINPGIFEITFIHYRDCGGIGLCGGGCGSSCSMALSLSGADAGCSSTSFGTITLSLVSVSDLQDNTNPTAKNSCDNMGCTAPGTFSPAYEKYIFKGLVNLGPASGIPSTCCNVRISYSNCCRSGQLPTGLNSENYYTDITINRCLVTSPDNNGPSPINDPMLITGPFQTQYSLGMIDAENDSITYELTPALSSYNTALSYSNAYKEYAPLPWMATGTLPGTMSIGAQNGLLQFSPGASSASYYGVVAIKVTEWKNINGVPTAVSVTRRDFQSFIQGNSVTNTPPTLQTFPSLTSSTPKLDWMVCAGDQVCFTLTAKDLDILDVPYLTFSLPPQLAGATITNLSVDPNRMDSIRFCWTSDSLETRETQYSFAVKLRDNKSPIDGKVHYRFTITVEPRKLIDNISKTESSCHTWNIGYTQQPDIFAPNMITRWRISSVPNDYSLNNARVYYHAASLTNLTFQDTGKYLVELNLTANDALSTCADIKYDTIEVTQLPINIILNDTSLCKFSSTTLSPVVKNKFGLLTYNWMNYGSSTVFNALSSINVSIASVPKKFVLKVTDGMGCTDYDTVTVSLKPLPSLSVSQLAGSSICIQRPFTFINTSSNNNISDLLYTWKVNDSIIVAGDTLIYTAPTAGIYNIKLVTQIPAGCKDSVTTPATVYGRPISSFTINNDTQCIKGNQFSFTNTSSISPVVPLSYEWMYGNISSTDETPPAISFTNIGSQLVLLIASNAGGCKDTSYQVVRVLPQPVLDFALATPSLCFEHHQYTAINRSPNKGDSSYSYSWTSESGTSASDTFVQTFATPGTKYIQLNVVTNLGCRDSLIQQAIVATTPTASFTINNSTQCLNGNLFILTNTTNNVSATDWNIDGQHFYSQDIAPQFETTGVKLITQIVSNSYGCSDTIQKAVEVLASPVATITVDDIDQCENTPFTFTYSNQMTPPATLTSSFAFSDGITNSTSPFTRTFTQPGTFVAKSLAIASNGCTDTASINIEVFPKPMPLSITGPFTARAGTPQTYFTTNTAGYVYSWAVQDGAIQSGNGTHQVSVIWNIATSAGAISVIPTSSEGCIGDSAHASIEITPNIGLNEVNSFADVQVFPNPATDQIMVSLQSLKHQNIKLSLVNVLGETIQSTNQNIVGSFEHSFQTAYLPRGLYFLSIVGESSTQTFKIVLR